MNLWRVYLLHFWAIFVYTFDTPAGRKTAEAQEVCFHFTTKHFLASPFCLHSPKFLTTNAFKSICLKNF